MNYFLITAVFVITLVLTTTLFSKTLRRKIRVFIDKDFYRDKYDYRTQWLQFTQRITSARSFDELASAFLEGFASAVGSKTKSLWLYDNEKDIFYQVHPHSISHNSLKLKSDSNLISFFKEKGWVFNIKDGDYRVIEQNREFFENTQASLVVPLISNGDIKGFIVLGESPDSDTYNYKDYQLLKTLARQTTSAIMNIRLAKELAEKREMEAIGRISSFVIHDLKNLASTLKIAVENAINNINNPKFQKDMLKNLTNTVVKMDSLIMKLSDMPKKISLNYEHVDLVQLIKETVKPFLNGKTKVELELPEQLLCYVDREEIKKVVLNLLLNALEATNSKGNVNIKMSKDKGMACITVSDKGHGMSEEYIEKHLFKPFHTKKKNGLGIGLYQCKIIVEAHKGSIKVMSKEGEGTDFTLYLPLV